MTKTKRFGKVHSAQPSLLSASIVDVEVDLSKGLYQFSVVGLPGKAVEESRDRVSAAIKNTGYTSPKNKNQKTVVSLAPANLKKEGPVFDVAIALAYLLAAGDSAFDAEGRLFLGELTLDGDIRPIAGVLPIARRAQQLGYRELFVPRENAREAALIQGINVYGVATLAELIAHLTSKDASLLKQPPTPFEPRTHAPSLTFDDIQGQETAKRGLEIAAAGGHNIALFGPPGTGKTLLARALVSILPPLSYDETLEVTSIHSCAGVLQDDLVAAPPFRAPHHTSSYPAVIGGGGNTVRAGEVTLAHHGVLFLDEFPEFDRRVVEALRQPLEDRVANISRAGGSAQFPANFILVAAMNPCPCGNFRTHKTCTCTASDLARYQRKLSGPIVDRIDMWIEVPNISVEDLTRKRKPRGKKESARVRNRIQEARVRQGERFATHNSACTKNSDMNVRDITNIIALDEETQRIATDASKKYELSPRAYHRVLKLARTIADLDGSEDVRQHHLYEALQYRPKSAF